MDKNIDYEEVALIQLNKAIELYFEQNYIPAITLAGAAEELSGKMLVYSKGQKPFLEELHSKVSTAFPEISNKKEKRKLISLMNNAKDIMKHFQENNNQIEFKPIDDSVMIIMRAIYNFTALTEKKSNLIEKFYKDPTVRKVLNLK